MSLSEKTTFEVSHQTNARAGMLQLQLKLVNTNIRNRDALVNFLLDYYFDNELKKTKPSSH
jgi:hypothetical protein